MKKEGNKKSNKAVALFLELFGWYGTAAIVATYALSSFGVLRTDNFVYQILNLTGALGLVSVSLHKRAYQPAALNTIWSVVALLALIGMAMR